MSIASYLPGGRLGDRLQRGPVVALTFVFFALFPLAVRLATSGPALVAAFCLGGLKEIGEPSRKSLILDLAPAGERARIGRDVLRHPQPDRRPGGDPRRPALAACRRLCRSTSRSGSLPSVRAVFMLTAMEL